MNGDSKPKQKWKSSYLELPDQSLTVRLDPPYSKHPWVQTKNVATERLKPLRQIATYCRYADTRYAFILTQTELDALRIRRIHAPKMDGRLSQLLRLSTKTEVKLDTCAAVEWAAVLWDNAGPDEMTVNLGIWNLGCMASNEKERHVEAPVDGTTRVPLDSMAKLTWWKWDEKRSEYENGISRCRSPVS